MAKESMSERNSNPEYFETISCKCGRATDLLKHRYSEEFACVDCANDLANKYREEKEREEETFGREGYYAEMSLNQIMQERNS